MFDLIREIFIKSCVLLITLIFIGCSPDREESEKTQSKPEAITPSLDSSKDKAVDTSADNNASQHGWGQRSDEEIREGFGACNYLNAATFSQGVTAFVMQSVQRSPAVLDSVGLTILGDDTYRRGLIVGALHYLISVSGKILAVFEKVYEGGTYDGNFIYVSPQNEPIFADKGKFQETLDCYRNFPKWVKENTETIGIFDEDTLPYGTSTIDEFVDGAVKSSEGYPGLPAITYDSNEGPSCTYVCSTETECMQACEEVMKEHSCVNIKTLRIPPVCDKPDLLVRSLRFCTDQAIPCDVKKKDSVANLLKERVQFFNSLGGPVRILTRDEASGGQGATRLERGL